MGRVTTTLTIGVPGSGKTYSRCARFLIDDFLPNETGVHWSNFPVKREAIAQEMEKRTGRPAAEFLERIRVIPREEEKAWREGQSDPVKFFQREGIDPAGVHLAIDEAHTIVSRQHDQKHVRRWVDLCSELRHLHCTVEFITQAEERLHKSISEVAETRIYLTNNQTRRDPFFGVMMSDWYELKAAFLTGRYTSAIWEEEGRKVHGRFRIERLRKWSLDPYFFQFYDSYSAPKAFSVSTEKPKEYEFQKRSRLSLVGWFLRRNGVDVVGRLGLAVAAWWFLLGGGLQSSANAFFDKVRHDVEASKGDDVKPKEKPKPSDHREWRPASTLAPGRGLPLTATPQQVQQAQNWENDPFKIKTPAPQGPVPGAKTLKQLEMDALEEMMKAWEIYMEQESQLAVISPEAFVMANGDVYRVGDVIKRGQYGGYSVNVIDTEGSTVDLVSRDGLHHRTLSFVDLERMQLAREIYLRHRNASAALRDALPDAAGPQFRGDEIEGTGRATDLPSAFNPAP